MLRLVLPIFLAFAALQTSVPSVHASNKTKVVEKTNGKGATKGAKKPWLQRFAVGRFIHRRMKIRAMRRHRVTILERRLAKATKDVAAGRARLRELRGQVGARSGDRRAGKKAKEVELKADQIRGMETEADSTRPEHALSAVRVTFRLADGSEVTRYVAELIREGDAGVMDVAEMSIDRTLSGLVHQATFEGVGGLDFKIDNLRIAGNELREAIARTSKE